MAMMKLSKRTMRSGHEDIFLCFGLRKIFLAVILRSLKISCSIVGSEGVEKSLNIS
jgi:hypothetical protein